MLAFPDSLAARAQVYELGSANQRHSLQTLNQEQREWKIIHILVATAVKVPSLQGTAAVQAAAFSAWQQRPHQTGSVESLWQRSCQNLAEIAPVLQLPRNPVNY